ncbi:MAG: helix-turn-helix domain-containing protein [Actinobacteria bacterium]|nr:helix-turn-helix domain-containing protein [Actinomycetota bacterium]
MYPRQTVDIAMQLSRIGVLDRENAQICGVSIKSIRHWRYGTRRNPANSRRASHCPRCDGEALDGAAYAYLLGLYLGDGCLTKYRKGVYMLNVACCNDWPGLMDAAQIAMSAVMPASKVSRRAKQGCTSVNSYSKHWPCLFPQHGAGRKHTRRIILEPWQQAIVDEFPGPFARGLFHSDGYRGLNRIKHSLPSGDRLYAYPRYLFVNQSADIRAMCGQALDELGVAWRYSKQNTISVARRKAVARLDQFVGPKY